MSNRQIVLDIETTGLDYRDQHRIIEIGCVELVDREFTGVDFSRYINPQRGIDRGALEVHGITESFLADKPIFADIADELLAYLKGAQLVIHNAEFDTGFINHELSLLKGDRRKLGDHCEILDTLTMAKQLHPGQRNNLDALCKRYHINNEARSQHGAMVDARILAEVYLAMSGGQVEFFSGDLKTQRERQPSTPRPSVVLGQLPPTPVVAATADEQAAHADFLQIIQQHSDHGCLWLQADEAAAAGDSTAAAKDQSKI